MSDHDNIPTPRTDTFGSERRPCGNHNEYAAILNSWAVFARTLERELATVTKERDNANEHARHSMEVGIAVQSERDALRAEVGRLVNALTKIREDAPNLDTAVAIAKVAIGHSDNPAPAQSEPSREAGSFKLFETTGTIFVSKSEEPSQVGGKEDQHTDDCFIHTQDSKGACDCGLTLRHLTAAQATIVELQQKLEDHAEDWAMSGIPHDGLLAKSLVLSDQNHKLRAENAALCEQRNRLAAEVGALRTENAALRVERDEALKRSNFYTERSVGAMHIAEGEEGHDRIPRDCPMLQAVSHLRQQFEAEKSRRLYYQDIVYYACNLVDKAAENRPGSGVVCGTFETPSNELQEVLFELYEDFTTLRTQLATALEERDHARSERDVLRKEGVDKQTRLDQMKGLR